MRPKLPFWTLMLTLLFLTQLGWWGVLLWTQAEEVQETQMLRLHAQLRHANESWGHDTHQTEKSWQSLTNQFPDIIWAPGPENAGALQIDAKKLVEINESVATTRRMILSEALIFFALAGLGITLIFRTLRRDSFLSLQQSNFLHAVTHELRSPLQGIRLAAETLSKRDGEKKSLEYANDILVDTSRLESLVNNVLDVGRLDARGFQAQPVEVNLSIEIETILATIKRKKTPPTNIQSTKIQPAVFAQVDPSTLTPILLNLLDNAIKYGEGKPITITLKSADGYAILQIQDKGRGIKKSDMPHIFKKFWRAGDERVRTFPGVGLGLFLTQSLTEAQGATLTAQSEGIGMGSLFEIQWPLAKGSRSNV